MGWFSGPQKEQVRYKGLFGETVVRTRYNDTGKVTKTVTRRGLLGGTVSETYVIKPGSKRK
jgi:hypothetical protein